MATTSLKRHSSTSFEASSCGIQIESDKVSVHRQFPVRTDDFPVLVVVLPVSTEIIETQSLSHPLGTCKFKTMVRKTTHINTV